MNLNKCQEIPELHEGFLGFAILEGTQYNYLMISIIDRYIARQFLGFFIAGLVVFGTLFVAIDMMTSLVKFDVSFGILFKYYGYYVFEILHQMLPVACLVGTVFTLTSMNKSNEVVALFSAGMSLFRISLPILFMVFFVSGLGFWFSDQILPRFTKNKNFIYYTYIKKTPSLYSTIKVDKIWYKSQNTIFYMKALSAEERKAQGLMMYYFDPRWKLVQLISADKVQINGKFWELENGDITLFETPTQSPMTQHFAKKRVSVGPDLEDLQTSSTPSNSMSVGELNRLIHRNRSAGLQTLSYEVDFHAKFSFALASVMMSFLGLPFTIGKARSGGMTVSIGLCIGLAFLYWVGYSSGLTLGRHGALPPAISVWLPNAVMAALGVFLLKKVRK